MTHAIAHLVREGLRLIPAMLLCGLVALPAPALAQQPDIRRPRLPADLDTNDARAYYTWGGARGTRYDRAREAFYWAWRLEPMQTGYLYAMWFAEWYRQPQEWRREYSAGAEYVLRSRQTRALDSLLGEVLLRDPFPHFVGVTCLYYEGADRWRDKVLAGIVHFDNNCWRRALRYFGEALDEEPDLLNVRLYRARAFYFVRQYDSTIAELKTVLDTLRARDLEHLTYVYNSKEMLEYMTGVAHMQRYQLEAARAAFGRALTENLAFAPAHARLADAALRQNDVETAIVEYELAVGIDPENGVFRHQYGAALLRARRFEDAEQQLREAVRLEPYWALPYMNLGVALQNQDRHEEAIAAYREYIARAPRRLISEIQTARDRIAGLEGERP